jgi:predicted amidohydrolase YtcJ
MKYVKFPFSTRRVIRISTAKAGDMSNFSRRDFLYGLSAVPLLALLRTQEPELILYNANIWTVDANQPRAQAVAISGGRFAAVGSDREILGLAAGRSRKIDLGGHTVFPGFIDAHAHPAESGRNHLRMVACDLPSISRIVAALRERADKTPPGEWVLGFLYDDSKTEHPVTRQELDTAGPNHPVIVYHRGGHIAFANSLALKTAGVNDQTPDTDGGLFERGPGGFTGRVADKAVAVINKVIPEMSSPQDGREAVKLISKMMTRKGITSAGDASANPDDLRAYQDAYGAGELSTRVYSIMFVDFLDRMIAAGIHTGLGDEWVRVGGIKQFADGSISERTARLSQPYVDRPDYYGLFLSTEDQLYENGRKAHSAGWQLSTHANGDVAIDRVLNVYERIQRESPRPDPRFRIEHCTLINDSLVHRMKALQVIPVPFSGYVYYHGEKMRFYGAERTTHMFAMRTFLDAGLRPTDSSDYTASPFDPMMWLQSQTTRTDPEGNVWGPNQRITLEEAIRCGTIHGAYASFEENLKGSIEPGKLADLIVLGRDPFRESPATLTSIPVERTLVGGRWMYES